MIYATDHPEDKAITAVPVSSHDDLVKQEHRMYRKVMATAYIVLAMLFAFFALRQG